MRLAFYTPNYPGISSDGGIGSYTKTLAEQLVTLGCTVHIITPGTGETSTVNGVTIHQVWLRHLPLVDRVWPGLGHCWHLARKLASVVKQHRIDLVELPNWEGYGILYQKQKLTPTVVRLHTSSLETQKIDELLSTRLLRADVKREFRQAWQADLLITHSGAHRHMMAEELGCQPDVITVIPHGVTVYPEFVRPSRSPGPPRLVYLGRLERRKGTLDLLQAFPHILKHYPGTTLNLIGSDRPHCPANDDGQPRTHAQWIADELPMEVRQHIHLLGRLPQEEVNRCLQTADVFIAPSRYESFGLIYPEAMRWGIPAVGCNVGGVPEIITHNVTGVLCDPAAPSQLAETVCSLLKDEAWRQRLGQAGKLHVEQHFSAEQMAKRVLDCYQKMVRKRSSPA